MDHKRYYAIKDAVHNMSPKLKEASEAAITYEYGDACLSDFNVLTESKIIRDTHDTDMYPNLTMWCEFIINHYNNALK